MPPGMEHPKYGRGAGAFVCGLLHDSELPTLLGSAAFSRATLSNGIWLSSGRHAPTEVSAEGQDLGLRRRGEEEGNRERTRQPAS